MKNKNSEKEQNNEKKEQDPFIYAVILVVSLMLGVVILILKVAGVI